MIIYQIEHYKDNFNIPILEYVIFTQNGSVNLSLDICDNVTVKYNIPVNISKDEIYKYDPNDDFYNNECNKHSTDGKVDMTLYDRKNEFNNNNLSLCESNCQFLGYNDLTAKAICDCKVKKDVGLSDTDDGNLLNKIDTEKSKSNLKVTQCIKEFVKPENIKSNGGFYTILIIIIILIIVFIIFWVKGKSMIENKIDQTIYKKFSENNNDIIKTENKTKKKTFKEKNNKINHKP